MIQKMLARDRYRSRFEWLDTYHLFSFANYYDPANLHFGNLRVFNDDVISPHQGFDHHGHDNMEIVTIMLEGVLTHTDSMGNKATIRTGEVQRMSAGTGVVHAEKNEGDERVHLYQIWFTPDRQDAPASYEQKDFSSQKETKGLSCVVSKDGKDGSLSMGADASVFLSQLDIYQNISYSLGDGRGLFVYVTTGRLEVNGNVFEQGDQARINNEKEISIRVLEDSTFILIDVALN